MNYGLKGVVTEEQGEIIKQIYKIFENEFKIIIILIGSFLSWQILKSEKGMRFRKINLIAFSSTAIVIHGIIPWLINNREIYYFFMPLPWSTLGLQLMSPSSTYYSEQLNIWGIRGITIAITFFIIMNIVVFLGTIIGGRRFQCSYLCMLNGFASEIWSDIFPLIGKKKKLNNILLNFFKVLRWVIFIIALFLTIWWVFRLAGIPILGNGDFLYKFEIIKYLSLELLMMMFFWIIWTGRGYCYYCPLGTFLSLISRLSGQRIKTDNTNCIQCGKCTKVCPMNIDIAPLAKNGEPVKNLRCVGCGHCIDICPTNTLSYETNFLSWWKENNNN